jgi:tetratricopeptide (TPR) repeat protein
MRIFNLSLIIFFTLVNTLFGQPWNETTFKVLAAPELGEANFSNIIIAEIVNNRNRTDEHTRDIYDELANRITQIDGLALVDRQKTETLLKEFEFQQSSGLVNDNQIRKLGEFLGTGLIAFVRIQRDEFDDELFSDRMIIEINGCKTSKYRVANYDLHVNFKFVNLQTAEVIYSKNLVSSLSVKSKKYNCQTPPRFEKNDIFPQCVSDIGEKFKNLFVEYEQEYTVSFQKHSKINDRTKKAITYFKINEFEEGFSIISRIPEEQKNEKAKSASLYNLALVQLYAGKFKESLSNAKKAYILNPNNSDCLTIVNALE